MKRLAGIENFRIIAALLVIANHTAMLSSFSSEADFVFTYCLGRVAVPFFFMVSGYFVIGPWLKREDGSDRRMRNFLKKTVLLYAISTLLYVPVLAYSHQLPHDVWSLLRMIFFDGTYYHLWYFASIIVGTGVLFLLRRFPFSVIGLVTFLLYIIGECGDLWYGAIADIPLCKGFYDILFSFSTYTRNGLFFAPVFLYLGAAAHKQSKKHMLWLSVSVVLLVGEGLFTRYMGFQRFNSMYFSLLPVMWFLFMTLRKWQGRQIRYAGDLSLVVYIIHPLVILALRYAVKVLPVMEVCIANSLLLFFLTAVLSFSIALFVVLMRDLYGRKKKSLVCHIG